MKKIIIVSIIILISVIGYKIYEDYRIKNAKIKVVLKDNLETDVYSEVKVKDFIESVNGTKIENNKIDTTKIGIKTVTLKYTNDENIKVKYKFKINIIDREKPLIEGPSLINRKVGYDGNIIDNYWCADNYDDKVECTLIGEYDGNKIGSYDLKIEAIDSSSNKKEENIKLNIIKEEKSENKEIMPTHTYFKDVIKNYKNKETKIGIDVSKWEGDIDFKKVKKEGVEFAYIRLGTQKGKGGKYIVDKYFKQNYTGFKNNNIPVGVYFYSYAGSIEEAKKQAKWVLKQIKKYDIDLEVVFDWENWTDYGNYSLSFYHLTQIGNTFLDEIKKRGYNTMLYSSKNYLENVWQKTNHDIWLAHYTNQTNYEGKYKVWQMCDDGLIEGIEENIDIDIRYKS